MISLVSVVRQPGEDRPQSVPATLGELLYADQSKLRVSESEWVALVQSVAGTSSPFIRCMSKLIELFSH